MNPFIKSALRRSDSRLGRNQASRAPKSRAGVYGGATAPNPYTQTVSQAGSQPIQHTPANTSANVPAPAGTTANTTAPAGTTAPASPPTAPVTTTAAPVTTPTTPQVTNQTPNTSGALMPGGEWMTPEAIAAAGASSRANNPTQVIVDRAGNQYTPQEWAKRKSQYGAVAPSLFEGTGSVTYPQGANMDLGDRSAGTGAVQQQFLDYVNREFNGDMSKVPQDVVANLQRYATSQGGYFVPGKGFYGELNTAPIQIGNRNFNNYSGELNDDTINQANEYAQHRGLYFDRDKGYSLFPQPQNNVFVGEGEAVEPNGNIAGETTTPDWLEAANAQPNQDVDVFADASEFPFDAWN